MENLPSVSSPPYVCIPCRGWGMGGAVVHVCIYKVIKVVPCENGGNLPHVFSTPS